MSEHSPDRHSVRQHLRLDVADYDRTIRRFIPGYEAMLGAAANAVPPGARVVDLGAGTGALSEVILDRTDATWVELVDVDDEMTTRARERLDRFGARVRFSNRSYFDPFDDADAFVASLSLHHIPDMETKTELYRRAFERLARGGVLINADAFVPADGPARDASFRAWADHMVASGISEPHAWEHFEEWAAEDTYQPLDVELAALRRIGFEAEQVWSKGPMGVAVGRKR